MFTLILFAALLRPADPGALVAALGILLDQAGSIAAAVGPLALLHHLSQLCSLLSLPGQVRRLRRALPGAERAAPAPRRHRNARRLVGACDGLGSHGRTTMTDDLAQMTDPAQQYRAQQEAALALQDALCDGLRLGLPVLSWTITHGGVLCAKVLSHTPRTDFTAWAQHLNVEPEDLSRDGETILRVITDTGLPGRGRRVRVVLVATFRESSGQTSTAAA
ncbi:hypothetical protein [Streptomyces silvensis]|uniref:Uncharacterized protein n=1 Tax=Streptomyces silvensis TaxID=1765722 RepID=A0A0W7X3F1_9ACTN|nr:hypothetical protein [Streptomyces silvensis]KUF17364.1 hypothetical protein AT728_16310 [Streptomyces silvensis]